jgi:tetratricopeptide (TPR) repeat protein
VIARLRRDPGLALVWLACALAIALYAPTLRGNLLDRDDRWLYADNWIVRDASVESLRAIAFDTSRPIRGVLGAEYLPVRDTVALVEHAAWGTWWPGFHAVNLALYVAAIALWFAALVALGIDRRIAGLAALLWAVHPTHVEVVAWLAEQKGLLALALAGACVLGYARFRAGGSRRWLVLAVVAAVAAVWSKAPAAFTIAALAPLELVLPATAPRRRRAIALAAIGVATAAAFVPVVVVALRMGVVSAGERGGWLAGHGFYVRLAALAVPNAAAYAPAASTLDLVLGALGLAAAVAGACVRRAPVALRAGCVLWLLGWLPVSRLVLPVQRVALADRYLEFATLGAALALAAGLAAIASRRARAALVAAIVVAAGARTLAARGAWHDDVALWARVVHLDPGDGDAWAHYSEALDASGDHVSAAEAIDLGLDHGERPRLLLDKALATRDRAAVRPLIERAAEGGDPYAMTDLALLLDDGDPRALVWARRALEVGGEHAELESNLCRVALAAGAADEAIAACRRAHAMRPADPLTAFELARAIAH